MFRKMELISYIYQLWYHIFFPRKIPWFILWIRKLKTADMHIKFNWKNTVTMSEFAYWIIIGSRNLWCNDGQYLVEIFGMNTPMNPSFKCLIIKIQFHFYGSWWSCAILTDSSVLSTILANVCRTCDHRFSTPLHRVLLSMTELTKPILGCWNSVAVSSWWPCCWSVTHLESSWSVSEVISSSIAIEQNIIQGKL